MQVNCNLDIFVVVKFVEKGLRIPSHKAIQEMILSHGEFFYKPFPLNYKHFTQPYAKRNYSATITID